MSGKHRKRGRVPRPRVSIHAPSIPAIAGALLLAVLGGCASSGDSKAGAEGPNAPPAPAGMVSLAEIARESGALTGRDARTGRVYIESSGRRVELEGASRVAYIEGQLAIMPAIPEMRGETLYVSEDFARRLRGWAIAARASGPPPAPVARAVSPPPERRPAIERLPEPVRRPLEGFRVVLDPGHGGKDPGATSGGRPYEKEIALDVALEVKRLLERDGAEVTMTRADDTFVSLDGRAWISNRERTDAFVSIHANAAGNAKARGIEVYKAARRSSGHRPDKLDGSDRLARAVYARIDDVSPHGDRGVKPSPGYVVLKKNRHPSVLVELGFMTNAGEKRLLGQNDYRRRLAAAIAAGIRDFAASGPPLARLN